MRRTTSSWLSTIAKLGFKRSGDRRRRDHFRSVTRHFSVELLEDRRLPAVLTVNSNGDSHINTDGQLTLREAIEVVNLGSKLGLGSAQSQVVGDLGSNDTIQFSSSLLNQTITLNLGELPIEANVKIAGLGSDRLTISAAGSDDTPGVFDGHGSRVINVNGGPGDAISVELIGLKLTGGDAANSGGALQVTYDNIRITDLHIVGNGASNGGGVAILATTGNEVSFVRSTVANNVAHGLDSGVGNGGGISILMDGGASVDITETVIENNDSDQHGGGILVANSGATGSFSMRNSVVSGNDAGVGEANGSGGGVYALFGASHAEFTQRTVFERCVIKGNTATSHGGGMHILGAATYGGSSYVTALVKDCTVSGNTAVGNDGLGPGDSSYSGSGGGIFLWTGGLVRAVVVGSTISGNFAQNGGGMFLHGLSTVRHSTITGNTAKPFFEGEYSKGGGVLLTGDEVAKAYFGHVIIAKNFDLTDEDNDFRFDFSPDVDASGITEVRLSFSIVGDERGPLDELDPLYDGDLDPTVDTVGYLPNTDPMLGPLADNGGLEFSHGVALLTHLPQLNSPAIDAGDPFFEPNDPVVLLTVTTFSTDKRGPLFERVVDLPSVGAVNQFIDIGALERQLDEGQGHCFLFGDYNRNGIVDAADYTVWRDTFGDAVDQYAGADGDGDGTVDEDDYAVWKLHFGETCGGGGALSDPLVAPDCTQDGIVNEDDYEYWRQHFGTTDALADIDDNGIVDLADLAVLQGMYRVTTLDEIDGDLNGDGVVDSVDMELCEDANDVALVQANFGTTSAALLPLIENSAGGMPLEISGQAPKVTNVTIGGPVHADYSFAGVVGSGGQLRTVPVGGMDEISIRFSEEVLVTKGALTLVGLQGQTIPSVTDNNFTYDLATQTATWKFSSALPGGQYLIRLSDSIFDLDHESLDGEFENPWALADAVGTSDTFPSGDGEAGGEFRFRFTNLVGDYDRTNIVNPTDQGILTANAGAASGKIFTQGDANGDGYVNSADDTLDNPSFNLNYTVWPTYEPGLIRVTTLADENNTNPAATSLREALALATTQSGHDTIVFASNLYSGGPATITLGAAGQLVVNSDVTIDGPGADLLTINRSSTAGRIISVNSGKTATFDGLSISGGNGVATGGGIYNSGVLTLKEVNVKGNQSSNNAGGIYTDGQLFVFDSTIDLNVTKHGGGIYANLGTGDALRVERSTVSNNTAADGTGNGTGGGITAAAGSAAIPIDIINSTISGNSSGWVGGVRGTYSAQINIVNCTITNNTATGFTSSHAGGVGAIQSSVITLNNSIVAGNSAVDSGTRDAWRQQSWSINVAGSANNVIGLAGNSGLTNSNGNQVGISTPLNAGLTALGHYGGPTKTHALVSTSPAIDKGSNAKALDANDEPLLVDQRGFARDIDFATAGPTGGTIDVGAFEFAAPIIVSTAVDESDSKYADGDLSLREALALAAVIPGEDSIAFSDREFGQARTIVLTSTLGQLEIDSNLTVDGPGKSLLTIDAAADNDSSPQRVFLIEPGAVATIRGVTIKGGDLFDKGGGIYSRGDLTLEEVKVTDNFANFGGGIYHENGTLAIRRSEIDGNVAFFDVGGIYSDGAQLLLVESSSISQNSTDGGGTAGGLLIDGGEAELTNVTISGNGNDENYAAGVYIDNADVVFVNSTIAFNHSSSAVTGGIYATGTASVTLHNTLVAKNTVDQAAKDVYGVFESASSHNLLGLVTGSIGLAGGTGTIYGSITALDPRLLPLAYRGGLTRTHALVYDSPAIDAGNNSVALTYGLEFDQRGEPKNRFVDWDLDEDAQVDIGAFEVAIEEFYLPQSNPNPF